MARSIWQSYIQDANGRPRTGAVVSAKVTSTQVAAELFTTADGETPVASVTSATNGKAFFWIEPGIYDITVVYGSQTATMASVEIGPVLRDGEDPIVAPIITTPLADIDVMRGGVLEVFIVDGVLTLDVSIAALFILNPMGENCVVEIIGQEDARSVMYYLRVTTTGAYSFTGLSGTGITIYHASAMAGAGALQANGRTVIGFALADGELDVISCDMVEQGT